MNSDLLTRWTAIITNIAVVIGLVFVGLEFQNNSRSIEAERIDSFTQGVAEIQTVSLGSDKISEILYKSYAEPEALSEADIDRLQHLMFLYQGNFKRIHLAHQSGLISDEMYTNQKSAVGFVFSSEIGLETIEFMRASDINDDVWEAIKEPALQARAFCLNSKNTCAARYQAARKNSRIAQ